MKGFYIQASNRLLFTLYNWISQKGGRDGYQNTVKIEQLSYKTSFFLKMYISKRSFKGLVPKEMCTV